MQKNTYKIVPFGCAMNESDAERLKNVMNEHDFKDNDKNPFVVIFIACSVRQSAIDRVFGQVNQIKKKNSKCKIVLTGCVLAEDKKKFEKLVDILIDIKEIEKLPQLIKGVDNTKDASSNYFHIDPNRNSTISALVPVMTGCNNFCSYCAVPYTRGREYSRPVAEILNEVENLVKKGYKEIILLGQNVNSYKYIGFPKLIQKINAIKGDFWIRFFTSHPKDLSDELITAINECEKVGKYIHLPAQSGDNAILKKMNRKYSVGYYIKLIKKLRKVIPDITLSTDIIVGFPGETKKNFENSARLFRDIEYDMAYVSQFSPRTGTKASEMKDTIEKQEKKKRDKILTEILKKTALKKNKKYKNTIQEILVEKKLKNGKYVGKTKNYKYITFSSKENLIGKFIWVKITDVGAFKLEGKIVK